MYDRCRRPATAGPNGWSLADQALVAAGHELVLFARAIADEGRARSLCAAGAAARSERAGPDRGAPADARGGVLAGARVRRDPRACRLPRVPLRAARALPGRDDPARAPGPALARSGLPGIPRAARDLHLRPPAPAAARRALAGDDPPRRRRPVPLPGRPRRLPRVPDASRSRNGRSRHRDRSRAGRPLRIAAKIDAADRAYYEREIRPLFDHPLVDYVGELCDGEKNDFLGNAAAVLFPIDWPEPFGLIMIEALACGTPVIAWPHGSVPEVLRDGVSGYLCRSIDQAVRAVERIDTLDRRRCRAEVERRFTAERMARDYAAVYERFPGMTPEQTGFPILAEEGDDLAAWCSPAATASRCSIATAICAPPRPAGTASSSTARASCRLCACGSPGGDLCCSRPERAAGTKGFRSTRRIPTCATEMSCACRARASTSTARSSCSTAAAGWSSRYAATRPSRSRSSSSSASPRTSPTSSRSAARAARSAEPSRPRSSAATSSSSPTSGWIESRGTPGSPSSRRPSRSDRTSRVSSSSSCRVSAARSRSWSTASCAAASSVPAAAPSRCRARRAASPPRRCSSARRTPRSTPGSAARPPTSRCSPRRRAPVRSHTRGCPGSARRSAATR